ncbi:hypothetical protein NHU_00561 [Rhodovulum sulfidophilum]|uniref:Uncharacterized protein n=1 Tax=Rhodovulum sulfidophilum TaxID=35806 RepID=A0A0D6AYP2_RHOSU|nr:hypothetical protein NHU_00561 [Rhodovulum sulfidophilum]
MSGSGCERRLGPLDRPLAEAGYDPSEHGVLTVARYYFQSFAFPNSQAWINAFAKAESLFPPGMARAGASEIAVAVLAAVQQMRAARGSGFRFSNPDCPGCARILSPHERQFMEVLVALRRGRRSRAHAAAMLICEGNASETFLVAMSDLAALTGALSPGQVHPVGAQCDRGPAVS